MSFDSVIEIERKYGGNPKGFVAFETLYSNFQKKNQCGKRKNRQVPVEAKLLRQ